ncbi:hypothetical protein SLA2020_110860 [Shorea laevis]
MAKQFLGWYLVAVFLVWSNLFLQASAATDTVEVVALQDLYRALNSPSQLKRWKLDTGDPCEERWTGVSCSGSSMIHLKPIGLNLVESLGGQLDNFHHMRRDVSSINNLGEIRDCLSPYATLINWACNKLGRYIPQPLSFLTYLLHLNLSRKLLSGPNGTVFSGVKNLKDMFLQTNKFTGSVICLAELPLTDLKIQDSHFSGFIPQQFWSIPNFRVLGNRFDMGSSYPPGTFTLDNVSLLQSETSTQSSAIEDYTSLEVSRTKKKGLSHEAIGSGLVLVVTIAALLFAIHIKRFHASKLNSLERTSNPFIFLMWIANLFLCVTASRPLSPLVSTFRTKELSLPWVFVFFIIIVALNAQKKRKSKKGNKKRNHVENPKGKNDDMQGKGKNDDVLHPKGEVDDVLQRNGEVKDVLHPKGEVDDVLHPKGEVDDVLHPKGEADDVLQRNGEVEDVLHPKGKVDDVLHQKGEVDGVVHPKGEVDDVLVIGDGRLLVYTKKELSSRREVSVFEGYFDEELVAVKRVPQQLGRREVDILRKYRHRNVVAYRGKEEYKDSLYIALELCACNLEDLICQVSIKEEIKAFQLWKPNQKNRPSVQLIRLMKEIVEVLEFLHSNGIVHGDLKPRKILIKKEGDILLAKLCGLGTSVDIINIGNIKTQNATGADIFSLGWVFFYCITQAHHLFGEGDMFLLIDQPEAKDLVSRMIAVDPKNRPSAGQVKKHPLFWNASRRIEFLREANREVQNAISKKNKRFLSAVQSCLKINNTSWATKLDHLLVHEMRNKARYNHYCVADLLRLIRNTYTHHKQLDPKVRAILGTEEEELDYYFSSRFPQLFMNIYELLLYNSPCPADLEKYKWR